MSCQSYTLKRWQNLSRSGIYARPTSILFHQPLDGEPPLFHLPLVCHDFRLPLIIKVSLKKQNRLVLSQTVFYWMD